MCGPRNTVKKASCELAIPVSGWKVLRKYAYNYIHSVSAYRLQFTCQLRTRNVNALR